MSIQNDTPSTTPDTGLTCLVMLARLHGVAAEADQLNHQFGRAGKHFEAIEILRAAKTVGLKARQTLSRLDRLEQLQFPVIAQHNDGHFFIIAGVKEESGVRSVLIQDPQEQRPQIVPTSDLARNWSGSLILITKRAGLFSTERAFNFKWFIPAIFKYKKLFGEVLVASFFIQLLALVTPLFFQVVIDKVLVHKGLTTLDVLAFGLIVVSLFEVVLTGLRTYLFSHTAQRIDVGLGAKLFNHLLALPISYFEARRVGDTVARVRELENIRSFLTGSALTLVIDLLFTVVFLAVMYYYSPTLTFIVLGSIPFYVILSLIVTPILRHRVEEKFNRGAENQAFLGCITK